MTLLTVWREDEPETPDLRTEDAEEIAVVLKELGVRFEQWPLQELSDDVSQDEVLDAYRERIDAVTAAEGGTTHWFDMGTNPDYVSVRFFHDDDGWVGNFTGSGISRSFPTYDQLAAGRSAS